MKIGKFIYYTILLLTLILPLFSDGGFEPSWKEFEKWRIEDSIVLADSMRITDPHKSFVNNNLDYKSYHKNKVDSLCKIIGIEKIPTIYRWSFDHLTGLGLIKILLNNEYGFYVKWYFFLIPLLFYMWIFTQLILLIQNKNDYLIRYNHIFGIIISTALLILIIIGFPFSLFYYICYTVIMIKEFKYLNKSNAR